jgi:integrase/recombinase XerD
VAYVERAIAPARGMLAYVHAYTEQLKARNYASQTITFKAMALERFLGWCSERGITRITEITRPILQRYQRHLFHSTVRGGKPLSAAGQFNRLMAVRGFFRFLTRENILLYNPASELDLPKLERRLPKDTLTAEEAEAVMSQPDVTTPLGVRDRAILEVLYSTGIRRMEVVNLERQDAQESRGILAVRQGKGKKDRFVPIGDRALLWARKYLDDVRPDLELGDPHTLFLDPAGKKMDPHQLSRMVQRYVQVSGVGKKGRCHLFRHTMATLMLENGADIRYIQQMLGHAMLSTTEIYTHVSIVKLKEIHSATHPARLKRPRAELVPHQEPEPTAEDVLDALDAEAAEEDEDTPAPAAAVLRTSGPP